MPQVAECNRVRVKPRAGNSPVKDRGSAHNELAETSTFGV